MTKRCLSLVVGVALAGFCFAASQSQDSTKIVKERWILDAVKQLKRDELYIGYPDGLFPNPDSRYEVGVLIHATTQKLKDRVEEAGNYIAHLEAQADDHKLLVTSKSKALSMPPELAYLCKWRNDTDILLRLTTEFAMEIQSLGVDISEMKKDIQDLQIQLDILQPKATLAVSRTTTLLDLPKTHFVYEMLRNFKSDGLLTGVDSGGHRRASRKEFAIGLINSCENLIKWSEKTQTEICTLKSHVQQGVNDTNRPEFKKKAEELDGIVQYIDAYAKNIRNLERTIDFFELELKAMGKDPKEMKRQLREAL